MRALLIDLIEFLLLSTFLVALFLTFVAIFGGTK